MTTLTKIAKPATTMTKSDKPTQSKEARFSRAKFGKARFGDPSFYTKSAKP